MLGSLWDITNLVEIICSHYPPCVFDDLIVIGDDKMETGMLVCRFSSSLEIKLTEF